MMVSYKSSSPLLMRLGPVLEALPHRGFANILGITFGTGGGVATRVAQNPAREPQDGERTIRKGTISVEWCSHSYWI